MRLPKYRLTQSRTPGAIPLRNPPFQPHLGTTKDCYSDRTCLACESAAEEGLTSPTRSGILAQARRANIHMPDSLSPDERSRRMALIRGVDTKPEMQVRQLVHGMGYRYRLHGRNLPGKPDLVFRKRHAVVFVHGCFWHRHQGCHLARLPKSRLDFWEPKLEANRERDARNMTELQKMGWRVLVVWECELKDIDALRSRLRRFLDEEDNQ